MSPQVKMKLVVALALAPVASALVAPSAPAASKTVLADAKSDLVDLQNSIPGPPGFYDPLGLSDMSFALGMQGNADGGVRLRRPSYCRGHAHAITAFAAAAWGVDVVSSTPSTRRAHAITAPHNAGRPGGHDRLAPPLRDQARPHRHGRVPRLHRAVHAPRFRRAQVPPVPRLRCGQCINQMSRRISSMAWQCGLSPLDAAQLTG